MPKDDVIGRVRHYSNFEQCLDELRDINRQLEQASRDLSFISDDIKAITERGEAGR